MADARPTPTGLMPAPELKGDMVFGPGPVEEWIAVAGGGFVRAAHDLPALLYEADLLRLYPTLIAEDCHDLMQRQLSDRTAFLTYLKDTVGMSSLGDRQVLANALARAERIASSTKSAPTKL